MRKKRVRDREYMVVLSPGLTHAGLEAARKYLGWLTGKELDG